MASVGKMVRTVLTSLLRSRTPLPPRQTPRPSRTLNDTEPGRSGSHATVEIDPDAVGRIRMSYIPSTDGNPDPGEIVWTWVPYEEKDGRGKDRPVLVVATRPDGTALAVQLTSKPRGTEDVNFVSIGSGNWDAQGRPSWVGIDRVFVVQPDGMRREAAALGEAQFARVAHALGRRYGWR